MNAGSRSPLRARLLAGVAGIALVLCGAQPGAVAAAGDEVLVQDLLKKLEERDAAIVDLVDRVQQLERRLDAAAPAATTSGATGAAGGGAAGGGAAGGGAAAAAASGPAGQTGTPAGQTGAPAGTSPQTPADVGSPAAPGTFVVDPEAAERALERTLVSAGALLLPFGAVDVEPGFTYIRRETTTPGVFVPEEGRIVIGNRQIRENELVGSLDVRTGLPWGFQFEFGVPYRYQDISDAFLGTEESNSASGFGDVSLGVAKELFREQGWRPDLIARVAWDIDSGQEKNDIPLGSGFHSLTGSLTALKRQDPLAFVGSAFYSSSFEQDDIDPGDEFGFLIGTVLAASPDTSLSFSLQQTFSNETKFGGRSNPGSDQVNSVLVVGASSVLGRGVLLSVNAGVGLTDDAPDYFVNVSLPIRFNLPVR